MVKKNLPSPWARAAGQRAGEDLHVGAAGVQVTGDGEHVVDGAAELVELPGRQRVAGTQVVQRGGQVRAPGRTRPRSGRRVADRW